MIPRLAIKAKSLFDDNRRMHSEIRNLKAERADLEAQLKRVQTAMENMVRVAEIMNVRSRFTPPSSPHSDISDTLTARASVCATCGSVCPTCSTVAVPIIDRGEMVPMRTRWSMQLQRTVPKDFPSPEDNDEPNRLRILPPPRRVSRVPEADPTSRPTSIHLGDADCGVSLNRFRTSDDNVDSDDEAEHLAPSDIDECSKELDRADVDVNKMDAKPASRLSGLPIVEIAEIVQSRELQPMPVKDNPATHDPAAIASVIDAKHSHRTSFMICECECDGNSITTTDTHDGSGGGGDVIVVKTGMNGQKRMSMSLEQQNPQAMSLKVKMVTATVMRNGTSGETTSSLSASTFSVETDAGHEGPTVDDRDQEVTDVSLQLESPPAEDRKRNEPDGYPWW
jgi:hypothetical protein